MPPCDGVTLQMKVSGVRETYLCLSWWLRKSASIADACMFLDRFLSRIPQRGTVSAVGHGSPPRVGPIFMWPSSCFDFLIANTISWRLEPLKIIFNRVHHLTPLAPLPSIVASLSGWHVWRIIIFVRSAGAAGSRCSHHHHNFTSSMP
jgi:hypothetical protein